MAAAPGCVYYLPGQAPLPDGKLVHVKALLSCPSRCAFVSTVKRYTLRDIMPAYKTQSIPCLAPANIAGPGPGYV